MQLLNFVAFGLHGYINKSIQFNEDVTFITGINGTGKTSIVRSVVALLQPSLAYLLETEFLLISLEFWNDDTKRNISALKHQKTLTLFSANVSLVDGLPGMQTPLQKVNNDQRDDWERMVEALTPDEKYTVGLIEQDAYESPGRFRERWTDFVAEQEALSSGHPLIGFLRTIPTPMYLGLERRSEAEAIDDVQRRVGARRLRNLFSGSLYESLMDARRLAEEACRQTLAEQALLADQLRQNIILSAFGGKTKIFQNPIKWPDDSYIETLRKKHNTVRIALESVGLQPQTITKHVAPFFEELETIAAALVKFKDMQDALKNEGTKNYAISWIQLQPQEDRIDIIYKFVEAFNKQNEKLSVTITKYQELVNEFFIDSNKKLEFTSQGNVVIRLPNGQTRTITALSSGESHMLVILTQLMFNPKRELANILIIDEPELSLHIKWQEAFVKSVQSASEKLQIILATHSPSIFLDNIDKCVDLA